MKYIIGIDEVGYGSWAGPLVIGGVKAPEGWTMEGLRDSKKLSRNERERLTKELHKRADTGEIINNISLADNTKIDEKGLGACHKACYVETIHNLYLPGDGVVLDGNLNPKHLQKYGLTVDLNNIQSVVKADDKFPTVMAASILAKYYRDTMMIEYHKMRPEYGWENNVGYIVAEHREAVKKYGFSPLHRTSYKVKLT